MPEIKSKKTAARVKIGPADFLKTGVLWQTLSTALEYPENTLLSGQALPTRLDVRVPEHNENLRPTWAMKAPEAAQPSLLISAYRP